MPAGSVCVIRPHTFRSPPKLAGYDFRGGAADIDDKWTKSKRNSSCSKAEDSFDGFQRKVLAIAKQYAALMSDGERQEERYDKVREQFKRYSTTMDVDRIRQSVTNLESRLSSASETSIDSEGEGNLSSSMSESESDSARQSFESVLSELHVMAGGEVPRCKRESDSLKQPGVQLGLIRAFFLRELLQRSSVLLDATHMVDTPTRRVSCDPNERLAAPLACGDAQVSTPNTPFDSAAVNCQVRQFNARMLREPMGISWRDSPAASFEVLNAHDVHQRLCLEVKVAGHMEQRLGQTSVVAERQLQRRFRTQFGFRNVDPLVTFVHAVRHFETYILPVLNCHGHQVRREFTRGCIDKCSIRTRPADCLDDFAQRREALLCDVRRNNCHTLRRANYRRRKPQFALSVEDSKLVHDFTLMQLLDELRCEVPLDPPFGDVETRMRHNRLHLPESDRAIAQRVSAHNQLVAQLPLYAENFKLRARRARVSQRTSLVLRLAPQTARCSTWSNASVTLRQSIRRSTAAGTELRVFRCFASIADSGDCPVSALNRLSETKRRNSEQRVTLLRQLNAPRDSFGFARARFDLVEELAGRALRRKASLRVVDKRNTNKYAVEKPVASWFGNTALLHQICQFDKQTLKAVGFPLVSANCDKDKLSKYTLQVRSRAKQLTQARQRASSWDQLTSLSGSSVAKFEVVLSQFYSVAFDLKATFVKKLRTVHQDIDSLHALSMALRLECACSHYLRSKLLQDIRASRFSFAHSVVNSHERLQCTVRRYLKGERLKCSLRKCAAREQRSNQIALQHVQLMRNYGSCMQQLEGLQGRFGLLSTPVYYAFQHAQYYQPLFRLNLLAQLSKRDAVDDVRSRLRCVEKLKKQASATDRVHQTKKIVQAEIRAVCRKRSLEAARDGEKTRRRCFVRYWLPFRASSDATAFAYDRVALVLRLPTSQFHCMQQFRASLSASLRFQVEQLRGDARSSKFCEFENECMLRQRASLHLLSCTSSAATRKLHMLESTRLKRAQVTKELLTRSSKLLAELHRVEKRHDRPLRMCSAPELVLRNRSKVLLELRERDHSATPARPAKFSGARLFMPLLMAELRSRVLVRRMSVHEGTVEQAERRNLHERFSCLIRERLSLHFNEAQGKFRIALGQFGCDELRYFLLVKKSDHQAPLLDLSHLATLKQVVAHNSFLRRFPTDFIAIELRKSETSVCRSEKIDSALLFDEMRKQIARFSNLDWSQMCRLYARDALDIYDCSIEQVRLLSDKQIAVLTKTSYGAALEHRREREFGYLFANERNLRSFCREIESFRKCGGKLKIAFNISHVGPMTSNNSQLFVDFANKLRLRNMFNTRVRLALANIDRRSCAWVPRSDPKFAVRMKISVLRRLQRNKTLRLVNYGFMDAMHDLVLDDIELRHALSVRNTKLKQYLVRMGGSFGEGWKRTTPLFTTYSEADEVVSQTNVLLRGIVTALRSNTALGIYVSLSDVVENMHEIFERSELLTQVNHSLVNTWPFHQLSTASGEPSTSSYESYWADSQLYLMPTSSEPNSKRNRDSLSIVDENAFEEKLYRIWRVEDKTDELVVDLPQFLAVRSDIRKLKETPLTSNLRLSTCDELALSSRLAHSSIPPAFIGIGAADKCAVDVSTATFWLKVRINGQLLRQVRGTREIQQSVNKRASTWNQIKLRFMNELPNALTLAAVNLHPRNSEHWQTAAVVRLLNIIGLRKQNAQYCNASAERYFDSILHVRLRLAVHSEFDAKARLKLTERIKAMDNSPLYGRLDHLLDTGTEQRAFRIYIKSIKQFHSFPASTTLRYEDETLFGMFRFRKHLHEQISANCRVSAQSKQRFVRASFEHLLAQVKQADLKLRRGCNPFVRFTRTIMRHHKESDARFLDEMVLRRHDNVVRSLKQAGQSPTITHNQQWYIARERVFRRTLHGTSHNCASNRSEWVKKVREDCETEQRERLSRAAEKLREEGVKLRISGWSMMQVLTEMQAKHRLASELAIKPSRLNSRMGSVHSARQAPDVAQHQALQVELRLSLKRISVIASEKGRSCVGIFQRKHTAFAKFVHSAVMHYRHSLLSVCDVLFAVASLKERFNEQIVAEYRQHIRNGRLLNSYRVLAQRFWSSVFERVEVGRIYTEANMQLDVWRTYRMMAMRLSVNFDAEQMAQLRIRARINRQVVTFQKRKLTHVDFIQSLPNFSCHFDSTLQAEETKLDLFLRYETAKIAVRAKQRLCASVGALSVQNLKGLHHVIPVVKNLGEFVEEMPLSACKTYRSQFEITIREIVRAATRTQQVPDFMRCEQFNAAAAGAEEKVKNRLCAKHHARCSLPEKNLRSKHLHFNAEKAQSFRTSQTECYNKLCMHSKCDDITRFKLGVLHAARISKQWRTSLKAAKLRGSAELTSADVSYRDVMGEMIDCATIVHGRNDEPVKRSLFAYFKYHMPGQSFFGCKLDDAVYAKELVNRSLVQRHKMFTCGVAARMLSAVRNNTFTGANDDSFARRNKFELSAKFRRSFEKHSVSLNDSLQHVASDHHRSRSKNETVSSLSLMPVRRGKLLRDSFNETPLSNLRETISLGEVVCGLFGLMPSRDGNVCAPDSMVRMAYQAGLVHIAKQKVASELTRQFRTGKMHLSVGKTQECSSIEFLHGAREAKNLQVQVEATFAGQPLNIPQRILENFLPIITYKSISDEDEVAFRHHLVATYARDAPATFYRAKFRDSLRRKSFDDVATLDLSRCARFVGMSPSEIEGFFKGLEKHAIYADRLTSMLNSLKLPSQI